MAVASAVSTLAGLQRAAEIPGRRGGREAKSAALRWGGRWDGMDGLRAIGAAYSRWLDWAAWLVLAVGDGSHLGIAWGAWANGDRGASCLSILADVGHGRLLGAAGQCWAATGHSSGQRGRHGQGGQAQGRHSAAVGRHTSSAGRGWSARHHPSFAFAFAFASWRSSDDAHAWPHAGREGCERCRRHHQQTRRILAAVVQVLSAARTAIDIDDALSPCRHRKRLRSAALAHHCRSRTHRAACTDLAPHVTLPVSPSSLATPNSVSPNGLRC